MEHALATLQEAIAEAYPDREAIVWRDQRLSWAQFTDRTRRLGGVLASHGVGRVPDASSEPWASPHRHVALYTHNRPAYLEGMFGAWKASAASVNINFRYVAEELAYVLRDASAAAVIYEGRFAARLAEVRDSLPPDALLLRIDDGSGDVLLPGALDYEVALSEADPTVPLGPWSPDDRYILYTGGTTGYPKGVLWRQDDFLVGALGFHDRNGQPFASAADVVARAARGDRLRTLPAPPFMHGAAHWNALSTLLAGGTVVIQDHTDRFDATDVCGVIEREQVSSLLIVGDAFARPLLDHLASHNEQLPSLRYLLTGGAILSPAVKQALLARLPALQIIDVLGSSESGRQGVSRSRATDENRPTRFTPDTAAVVLSAERDRVLAPGTGEVGWLAQGGRVPLGYLGDPAKTAATFPVVDGVRYAVPGDRARLDPNGGIELLGREAATINTGGEKVFAEEVEQALKHHPAVLDALVVGRPSERWGSEVVAVVALKPGTPVSPAEVLAECGRHIARYKLPKAFVRVDAVTRSPSGKPDYAWARELATVVLGDGPVDATEWHSGGARA